MAARNEDGIVLADVASGGRFQRDDRQVLNEIYGVFSRRFIAAKEFLVIRARVHRRKLAARRREDDVIAMVCEVLRRHGELVEEEADVHEAAVFERHAILARRDDEDFSFRCGFTMAGNGWHHQADGEQQKQIFFHDGSFLSIHTFVFFCPDGGSMRSDIYFLPQSHIAWTMGESVRP